MRDCARPTAASSPIGDAAGGPQFTHVALYHAGIVIRNALFRLPARVDYRALPWVTYSDPELAQIGLSEAAARAQGPDPRAALVVCRKRPRPDRARHGGRGQDRHRTATGVSSAQRSSAPAAGDLILPWALAIAQRLKIGAMANLIVPYPTRGEAGKRAAGSFYTPALFSPRTRRLVRLLARISAEG